MCWLFRFVGVGLVDYGFIVCDFVFGFWWVTLLWFVIGSFVYYLVV